MKCRGALQNGYDRPNPWLPNATLGHPMPLQGLLWHATALGVCKRSELAFWVSQFQDFIIGHLSASFSTGNLSRNACRESRSRSADTISSTPSAQLAEALPYPCLLGSRRLRSIGSRLRGPLGECPRPRSLAMASWLRKSLRRKGSAEYSWKNMESAGRSIFAEKNALRYIQL